ncbi:MAG TPA: methylmalonyl-CoA mutase family protein [Thermoplasmata archaeon]|nr:methylmalonyl-CoA mutase family protein [Thermoplasmata archaeon]
MVRRAGKVRGKGSRTTVPAGSDARRERAVSGQTLSGRAVPLVAGPKDREVERYLQALGFPGEPPFTRGIRATMYRGRLWTAREYAGFGSAEATNRRFRYLLEQGNEGLSVAFDLPTQMGYDSDSPMARGEVGRVGVSISCLEEMRTLLDGLPLDRLSTSMTINATAPILLAFYVAAAQENGVARKALRGTVQNDILKEYIARSTYIYPPGPSVQLALDVVEFCAKEVPKWNAISVSGYHIREAGATAVQEIAFTFGDALAYLDAARQRGLDVDEIAPQISFFFNAHIDFFEEIAKFRAARRMWARLVEERYHPKRPESRMLRFHAQTAGVSLTAQQPENNAVRVALQALAALLGGAQSLHTNSMDEALSLPSEKAVRLALRTQQILAHESGVANTIDPAGGSYFLEELTDALEADATDLLQEVERRGGMLRAIETGWVQRQVADSAYRFQLELERGERTVVGVNAYEDEETRVPEYHLDPELEKKTVSRLREFRRSRDEWRASRAVRQVGKAAAEGENVMHPILDAVKAHATLGEISDILREVFGAHRARDEV